MANQYGLFWNSVSGDRTYDADSFAEWANTFFSTGVFNGDLQVTPAAGMVVSVGTGYANINGKIRLFEAETAFTLSPASGTYPRIDTIVVRRDETARQISLAYVQGAYSGLDPVPTEPTRTGGVYEIVLAQIMVAAGATAITAGDITDTRADETVCGWITGSVDSVDVDQLTAQARAQFDAWFEEMKGQLSEDAAGHLQLEIDDISDEIGNTDISEIGDGTITGAVSSLNAGLSHMPLLTNKAFNAVNQNVGQGNSYTCPVDGFYTWAIYGANNNTAMVFLNSDRNIQQALYATDTANNNNMVTFPCKAGTIIYTRASFGSYIVRGYWEL